MDKIEYAIFYATKAHRKERKQHTINHIKTAPLGSKLIVACDKINNLEDAISNIKEFGEDRVLSRNSVYESCIENVDANHPIFIRYKKVLEELWK